MDMYDKRKTKISYALLRLVMHVYDINNKTRDYGTDVPLHEAEIHVIKAVRESEGASVTALAQRLGVTKGAVSQILQKLVAKGMVHKETDAENLSRLVLTVTDQGETAYQNHRLLHQKFDAYVEEAALTATEDERAFLLRFLVSLEEGLVSFEERLNLEQ